MARVLLATYFFLQRQTTAFVFCLFFFFKNWLYIATDMADARATVRPLVTVGDPEFREHDWNTIFAGLGCPQYDRVIAGTTSRMERDDSQRGLAHQTGRRSTSPRLS
jgi:hypothetical protein